jgi:hypothetical protein
MRLSAEGMMLLSKIKVFLRRDAQMQLDLIRFTQEADYAREMLVFASDRGDQEIVRAAFRLMNELELANVTTGRGANLTRSGADPIARSGSSGNTQSAANSSRPTNFGATQNTRPGNTGIGTEFPATRVEGEPPNSTPGSPPNKRYVRGLR